MATKIEHITIKNIKIPIVFEEDKSLPITNIQFVFRNSGYIQDKNKSGLANISSKLLNEGTKQLGATKFASKLEEKAISLHTSNGFETFVIELSSLKDVSKKAISLLEDLIKSPNYTKETLDKLKTLQISSLKRKENDFDFLASKQLKSILFRNTALSNPSSGTIKSIEKISLDDVKNFINNTLCLNKLVVVAGGDFSIEELEKLMTPLLKSLKKGKTTPLKSIKINSKNEEKILLKDTEQAYIYFGSSFFTTYNDKNNYKARVTSFILGGSGFGSRLMEEIRVKRGLAYSAYSVISMNKSYSYFTGYLQTKNQSAKEAQELVKQLVKQFVKNGVSQEELDSAKSFLLGSEPLRNETLSQRLNKAFNIYYKELGEDFTKRELENIQNLTLEDLNNYIKSHSEIENLTFSIVRK